MQPLSPEQQSPHDVIWKTKCAIEKDRREMQRKAMETYDKAVYYPAIQANQEACRKIGHKFGSWVPNMLGTYLVRTCEYCGETEKQD